MKKFGLTGNPLSHSFSKTYFEDKFRTEQIENCSYELFPLNNISELPGLIENETDLIGLNVTIPYKVSVIPYLDELDEFAQETGAVNCIKIFRDNHPTYRSRVRNDSFRLVGYNTDVYGFENAILPLLKKQHILAYIIGTGGSANAVSYVFNKLDIDYVHISRNPEKSNHIGFNDIKESSFDNFKIIINTSPIGMYPDKDAFPPIPYSCLSDAHLLFDLIYNPDETMFMKKGKEKGAIVSNGLKMFELQAEKSWEIWNE